MGEKDRGRRERIVEEIKEEGERKKRSLGKGEKPM